EGKSLALTFAASKETFPETRRNFLAALASHPELKWRLVKEFWYAGEKIYEVYEVDRPPHIGVHHVAPQNPLAKLLNRSGANILRQAAAQPVLNSAQASEEQNRELLIST